MKYRLAKWKTENLQKKEKKNKKKQEQDESKNDEIRKKNPGNDKGYPFGRVFLKGKASFIIGGPSQNNEKTYTDGI